MDRKPVVFLAALAFAAACSSDIVIHDQFLRLSQTALVDSASVTAGPQRRGVQVTNVGSGAMSWTAHAILANGWLTLPVATGHGGDSLVVQLDPTGLTAGAAYRDTVVVESNAGEALRMPVAFVVIP